MIVVLRIGERIEVLGAQHACVDEPARFTFRIVYPSRRFSDLQSAICALRDGGVLFLLPGEYRESVRVPPGRSVRIRGVRRDDRIPRFILPEPSRFAPVDWFRDGRASPIVSVEQRAAVRIRNIVFEGGDAGIFSDGGSIDIFDTEFRRNGRGVLVAGLGAGTTVNVQAVKFIEALHNGMSLAGTFNAPCQVKINISGVFFYAPSNAGLLIKDCGPGDIDPIIALTFGTIAQAQNAGILLVRSGPVEFTNLHIGPSQTFGILSLGSSGSVRDSAIHSIQPSGTNLFGDGVLAAVDPQFLSPSNLTLLDNVIFDIARAGVANFGSVMALGNNAVFATAFALNNEPYLGFPPVYNNLGGNVCELGECVTISARLAPPQAINIDE